MSLSQKALGTGGNRSEGSNQNTLPRNHTSLRAAINRKCRECIFDRHGGSGTWRQQVEACTSTACPLYPVRPVSNPREGRILAVESTIPTDPMGRVGGAA